MKPIPIFSNEESRDIESCLVCDKPLDKDHWRIMYCSRTCRNAAHQSRKGKGSSARMTPRLYRKLEELREASRQEILLRR